MNPPFLLDTNSCVEFLRNRNKNVIQHIKSRPPDEIRLCSIVVAELYHGAWKSPRPAQNFAVLATFLPTFVSLPFDDSAAQIYGRIRADLEARGMPIGPNDLVIAAIALANNLTMVSHNTSEFSRIPTLRLIDWHLP